MKKAFLFLVLLSMFYIPSVEATKVSFVKITDYGLDTDNDGLFENLTVEARIWVDYAGDYLASSMLSMNISWKKEIVETITRWQYLDSGENYIKFNFNGSKIYEKGYEGKFDVEISVRKIGEANASESFYKTKNYNYMSFDSPYWKPIAEPKYVPIYTQTADEVVIKNDVITARVNKTKPEIVFYYTRDSLGWARFAIAFNRIIAFHDDDGYYKRGEEAYYGTFTDSTWYLMNLTRTGNKAYGDYISFNFTGLVDIFDLSKTLVSQARVTFNYLLATHSYKIDGYEILAGTEIKVCIEVEIIQALGIVNALSIEHSIYELSNVHSYYLHNFGKKLQKNVKSEGEIPIENGKISFLNRTNAERGYYAWSSKCKVSNIEQNVSASYLYDKKLYLYLSTPYSVESKKSCFDPIIGIVEGNEPVGPETEKKKEEEKHDPLYYSIGSIGAVCVISLTLYLQLKAYRIEERKRRG